MRIELLCYAQNEFWPHNHKIRTLTEQPQCVLMKTSYHLAAFVKLPVSSLFQSPSRSSDTHRRIHTLTLYACIKPKGTQSYKWAMDQPKQRQQDMRSKMCGIFLLMESTEASELGAYYLFESKEALFQTSRITIHSHYFASELLKIQRAIRNRSVPHPSFFKKKK